MKATVKAVKAVKAVPDWTAADDGATTDKGSNLTRVERGGTPEVSSRKGGEGIEVCERVEIKRGDLSVKELMAVEAWKNCGGDMRLFVSTSQLSRETRGMEHLLNRPLVRAYICQLHKLGECASLIADKEELSQCLTNNIRQGLGVNDSIDKLSKLEGYYPKERGGGGTMIQINISGSLED